MKEATFHKFCFVLCAFLFLVHSNESLNLWVAVGNIIIFISVRKTNKKINKGEK